MVGTPEGTGLTALLGPPVTCFNGPALLSSDRSLVEGKVLPRLLLLCCSIFLGIPPPAVSPESKYSLCSNSTASASSMLAALVLDMEAISGAAGELRLSKSSMRVAEVEVVLPCTAALSEQPLRIGVAGEAGKSASGCFWMPGSEALMLSVTAAASCFAANANLRAASGGSFAEPRSSERLPPWKDVFTATVVVFCDGTVPPIQGTEGSSTDSPTFTSWHTGTERSDSASGTVRSGAADELVAPP